MINSMTLLPVYLNTLGQYSIFTKFQLYMVVALLVTILVIAAYMIIYRKDEEKRTKAIQGIPIVIAAVVIMTLMIPLTIGMHRISEQLNEKISHDMSTDIYSSTETLTEKGEEPSFAEKAFIVIIDTITSSLVELRGLLYGTDMSLQKALFEDSGQILVNLDVSWGNANSGYQTVNLYTIILGTTYLFMLIAVGRVALKTLKVAIDEKETTELREQIMQLLILPAFIIMAPGFVRVLWLINSSMMMFIGDIDFTQLTTPEYSVFDKEFTGLKYGLSASIARIFMFFIEFKVWFILIQRKAMLNALYIIIPLAITVNAIGKEFDSLNMILRQLIKYTFIPFFYGIAYIIVLLLVRGTETGGNIMVHIVYYMILFTIADILAALFMTVGRGQDKPSGIGSMGGAGMAMAGATALMGIASSMASKGGSGARGLSTSKGGTTNQPSLLQTIASSNTAKMASTQISKAANNVANKIGTSNKPLFTTMKSVGQGIQKTAKQVGNQMNNFSQSNVGRAGVGLAKDIHAISKTRVAKGIGKGIVKGSAAIGAGLVATAATGNPIAGAMAAKGTGGVVNRLMSMATSDYKNHPRR